MKKTTAEEGRAQLERLCLAVLSLTVAQLVVAFWMRQQLWPVSPTTVIRSFMREDLIVIACFAAAGLGLTLLTYRSRRAPRVVVIALWSLGLAHLLLLAINATAVYWIRAPLTVEWIAEADLGRSETPWVMVRSVVTPRALAELAAALLLPAALLVLLWRFPPRLRALAPWGVGLAALACVLMIVTSRPAKADQWRDAVSSPATELLMSLRQPEVSLLLEGASDGSSSDYALRPAAAGVAAPPRPDILVVVLESVGARAVWPNLGRLPTMTRLAREGTIFPNASVAAANSTRSMFALVYSRYPRLSRTNEPDAIESGYPEPFLRTLRRGGYSTLFAQGGDFAFQSTDRMLESTDAGPLEDYSTISCNERVDRSRDNLQHHVWLSDRCTYDAVERWFTAQKGPRAAVVWPVSTHFPYDYERDTKAPAGSQAAYLDALEKTDRLLGEMLERMAQRGIRPVVVLTGDHGDAFGEHGFVLHGQTIFEEETGIPLIISGPGVPAGKVDERLAQIHDIGPTVVDLAGLARPCGWQGLSLFDQTKRQRAYLMALKRRPFAGYREGDAKFVFDLRENRIVQYDLRGDPGEMRPKPVTGAKAEEIRAALAGWAQYNEGLYNKGRGPCASPQA